MIELNKIWGFRSNKIWKKIIAIIIYVFLFLIFNSISTPEFDLGLKDLIVYKIQHVFLCLIIIGSFVFFINFKKIIAKFKIKNKFNLFMTFLFSLLTSFAFVFVLDCFYSDDYYNKLDENSKTKIIFENDINDISFVKSENLKIHFIDVGQGDSIFIELPNNLTMLIDAGESSKKEIVQNYIKELGIEKIDYLVGTHPHSDHIGGLAHIISNFKVGSVYVPKIADSISVSKTYQNFLETILQKNIDFNYAKAGTSILNADNLKIDCLSPKSDDYNNLNNYSVVIKINFENNSFLFMGDAETLIENEIVDDVSSDVIKIGHHGSDTSSSENFVSRVNAKYGIVMVGKDNNYNHPYKKILERWENSGTIIYRTDLNGNIVVTSNGELIDVKTSK